MMNLLFFQNCISPHQIPYIRECANDERVESVHLIVPRADYVVRKEMGWDSTHLLDETLIRLWLKPTDEQVIQLLKEKENTICLFSGIRAFAEIFSWFKLSLAYKVKRYIITEPPFVYSKPLWMHYLRFFIQDYKYVPYIDGIFGFGDLAVRYYRNISKKWKVFPFQYVTETIQRKLPPPMGKVKLLFVGSLIPRKNVQIVMEALEDNPEIDFTLIGDGSERMILEKIAQRYQVRANFLGIMSMSEVSKIMQKNDVLILPSLYDGWGTVVNEAMSLGLYVIVSDRCGAKALILDESDGLIFKSRNDRALKDSLNFVVAHIKDIRLKTDKRIEKAVRIQGKHVANYFVNCISRAKDDEKHL